MLSTRYWGLFWIAAGLSLHALLVGRLLESSFFLMLFFWGFVAFTALKGALDAAQAMSVVMLMLLGGVTLATHLGDTTAPSLAYATFALYPALVSWLCVFFYIRYLRQRDSGAVEQSAPLWWWQRHTG